MNTENKQDLLERKEQLKAEIDVLHKLLRVLVREQNEKSRTFSSLNERLGELVSEQLRAPASEFIVAQQNLVRERYEREREPLLQLLNEKLEEQRSTGAERELAAA